MPRPTQVLAEHPHADGVATVLRGPGGELWLAHDRADGAGTLLRDGAAILGLPGATIAGGPAPAGAVVAEVVDGRGRRHRCPADRGAWVVVLDEAAEGHLPPVCFRDADGALVVPRLAQTWARAPVEDAVTPCPACRGAPAWDVVTPSDDSRGSHEVRGEWRPTPVAVCRRCGHEEDVGAWYGAVDPEGHEDEQGLQRLKAEWAAKRAMEAAEVVAAATVPVMAADDVVLEVEGWGTRDGVLSSIRTTDAARSVVVEVELEEHAWDRVEDVARQGIEQLVEDDEGEEALPDVPSAAAMSLSANARRRREREAAWRASVRPATLVVDGEPQPCVVAELGNAFCAAVRGEGMLLTVWGRAPHGLGDLRLRSTASAWRPRA
ncbi:hypothetical protein [Conexibacter sp. SYSU D00693]|uniref:hypothetical protein n=1 Tax=Conexibacter sp. SYSU D00693 TaxID=2812560 RepID=UPI00196ACDDD|nr:hypothetical protein [Conexibacter sp. SYSU D00693]